MYQLPEPTRREPDLLAAGIHESGRAGTTWYALASRLAWPPAPTLDAETAECTCPTDCIRDHEYE